MIQNYINFIVDIMGMDFIQNKRNARHPLYKDYWTFHTLPYSNSSEKALRDSMYGQATAMFNAVVFSNSSSARTDELFSYGDFSDLGSEKVAVDIEGRLGTLRKKAENTRTKGKKTESIITELCVASWLIPLCSGVKALQDDSMPDFICSVKKMAVECKTYIDAKTIDKFLDNHISKANKQFSIAFEKYGQDHSGILVFDLTRYFSELKTRTIEGTSKVYQDEYFLDLEKKISTRIIRRKHIHWVLYYWDEISLLNSGLAASILRDSRWVKNISGQEDAAPLEKYSIFLSLST